MPVAVEIHLFRRNAEPRRLQILGRAGDDGDELGFQLAHIRLLRIGPALGLEHGPMVGVGRDKEDVIDAGRRLGLLADGRHRLPGRRPPEIEADERDAFVVGGEHHGAGVQRIEHADARRIMPRRVTPHRIPKRRRDDDLGRAGLEVFGPRRRENKCKDGQESEETSHALVV
jgi:hypothetical protein